MKKNAEFAVKKAGTFAARRALTGWIPIVGWIISAADLIYTGVEVYQMVNELKTQIKDIKETLERLKDSAQKIKDTLEKYDISKIIDIDSDDAQGLMSDIQTAVAASDKCLRARKCTLVPYNKTGSEDNWSGQGCCPGQTGHHLIPDAMFRDPSKREGDLAE